MNRLSIVIPSKTTANFIACAEAIRKHEPWARIIVVDDGIDWSFLPREDLMPCYGIKGVKPFVFARNVNIGIKFAEPDDVVIMNDDALLQTPGGLSLLQKEAEEHPEFGIIASTTNNVGNTNQMRKSIGLRPDPRMVCFVCVLIPRRILDAIGPLDERYTSYGLDDDDYCLRLRLAGYRIGIHDGCYVDHQSLPSSFRGPAGKGGDFKSNLEIFKEKWGVDNHGRVA